MLDDLNQDQKKAVMTTETNLLVSACPGAGKTRLLQEKASYILNKIPNAKLLALTFTKDAAEEILERIKASVDSKQIKNVSAGTFHSLAQKQLRLAGKKFSLITPSARFQILNRLILRYGAGEEFDKVMEGFQYYKSKIVDPRSLPASPVTTVFLRYQEELKKYNKLDFDDLLLESVKGMQDGSVAPYAVDYIFVDEFQDLDEIQYEWIRCHNKSIITAVGDEDQSIYAFRAALGYKGMTAFESDFKSDKVLLGLNYRCKGEILSSADSLIKNNTDRNVKELIANKGLGGSVSYRHFSDQDSEVHAIVDRITKSGGENYGDWAVLTRTNKMMDKVEGSLCVYNIPYRRYGGTSIWSNSAVEIFINFLLELESQQDVFNTLSMLTWSGIGDEDIHKISPLLGARGTTMWNSPDKGIYIELLGSGKTVYKSFCKNLPVWIRLMSKKRYEMVISSVFNWMIFNTKSKTEVMLLEVAASSLNKLIKLSIRKRAEIVRPKNDKNKDKTNEVKLYTIHKSKGLEFKNVWMPFVDEGALPHNDSSVDEERRLAYVGMTRAEDSLYLSSSKTPSRFIEESGLS